MTQQEPPEEIIELEGQYYIHAGSSRVDDRTLVLKHGETFGVFDRYGDIHPVRAKEEGVFHDGTRFLSHLDVRLGPGRPLLLNSTTRRDSPLLTVDLTNTDLSLPDVRVPKGNVHLFRAKFLHDGAAYERMRFTNFLDEPLRLPVSIQFSADFKDLFEVRGHARPRRGRLEPARIDEKGVVLSYEGLDGCTRSTHLRWSHPPRRLTDDEALFDLELPARGVETLFMQATFVSDAARARGTASQPAPDEASFGSARSELEADVARARAGACVVSTSNERFNEWLAQSVADLRMMLTRTPHGLYPYAGVPWFSTVFGRDGLITGLETLWFQPSIARGVLAHLAAEQATTNETERDAEPGKILHESRAGEMASLGEIPFGRYFGSVDATPLFVVLAGRYLSRTGDREFLRGLWPHVARAVAWVRTSLEGNGFLTYQRRSANGLANQGWKDSHDSVFHTDGTLASGPIALSEVQGYAYAALIEGAALARLFEPEMAASWDADAEALRARFEATFWDERMGTYVLALDGDQAPCAVATSNAGQVLWSGIASPQRAERVVARLLDEDSFSGWGVRTVAQGAARYNPLSYHNGSIWPHDNALIGSGFARYGHKEAVLRILGGMFDASMHLDHQRMPELFCGFPRRDDEEPTRYPLACAPQAWSAGVPLLLLESALGLRIDPREGRVVLDRPVLPPFLERVTFVGLPVDGVRGTSLDLVCVRAEDDVLVHVPRRSGDVDVVTVK